MGIFLGTKCVNAYLGSSSVDISVGSGFVKLINFQISGISYKAVAGMTFQEWIDSSYNTDGFYSMDDLVVSSDGNGALSPDGASFYYASEPIKDGLNYPLFYGE